VIIYAGRVNQIISREGLKQKGKEYAQKNAIIAVKLFVYAKIFTFLIVNFINELSIATSIKKKPNSLRTIFVQSSHCKLKHNSKDRGILRLNHMRWSVSNCGETLKLFGTNHHPKGRWGPSQDIGNKLNSWAIRNQASKAERLWRRLNDCKARRETGRYSLVPCESRPREVGVYFAWYLSIYSEISWRRG
jgi:hypothetical protein